MKIFGYTSNADQACDQFEKAASNSAQPRLALLWNKIRLCDYEILLVSHYPLILEKLNDGWYDPQKLIDLHAALVKVLGGLVDNTFQEKAWAVIDEIGEPLSPDFQKKDNPFFKKFREDPTGKRFFILLTGLEPDGLPAHNLNFLCNLWQIENGFTPIHSASIIHKGKLFLFCGPHGSGKSTIARLSEITGDTVLDDDLLLIPHSPTKNFSARAWGYSLETSTAPLCAIFKIVQDDEDRLIPLKQSQTAHFLVERSIEVVGNTLHDRMMDKLFKQIAAITRCVPGYELHFRNRPDFWKLIDEQIPT
jgi:hypothetical protein